MNFWKFSSWFNHHARWSTIGWLCIIAVGAVWEILGALHHSDTTFTELVRSTVPIPARLAILGVLIWHFCIARANYR